MNDFEICIAIFLFIFGLCIGSFSNVLIYRMPKFESINFPASHCTSCQTPLKWYHNVPVFSWLFLGGKCGFCKEKISIIYPFVELCSGIFMLFAYFKEIGFGVGGFYELGTLGYTLVFMAGLCFITLFALSIIDFRYKAVPDLLLYVAVAFSLAYGIAKNLQTNESFYHNLICAAVFAFAFWLLRFLVSFFMKKEAMGSADIFIAAVIGAILGYKLGVIAVYLSALLTLPAYALVQKKGYELAFVPFLSLGLFLVYIFENSFLNLIGFLYE